MTDKDTGPPECSERAAENAQSWRAVHQKNTAERSDAHGLLARWQLLLLAAFDWRLSRADVAALAAILDRIDTRTGEAWPGLSKIASDAQIARSSAIRGIVRLCGLGYLEREQGNHNRSNRYRMGQPASSELRPSRKSAPGSEPATQGSSEPETNLVANLRPWVVASFGPEPASLNLPNEPASVEPAPLLTAVAASEYSDGFLGFWKVWPKKEDKQAAWKVWKSNKLEKLGSQIIAVVEARATQDPNWRDPQFIPGPAKYLRNRRWEDQWRRSPANPNQGSTVEAVTAADEVRAAEINAAALQRLGVRK